MEKLKKIEHQIILAIVLGVVISSLLLFLGDIKKTFWILFSFNWRLAPLILGFTCFNYLLRFLRWHIFLGRLQLTPLSWRKSGLIFLAGLPLTLTPGKTGEALKAYFLKKIIGDHFSRTVSIVFIERLTDGLAAAVLLSSGVAVFHPLGWGLTFLIWGITGGFIFCIYQDFFWQGLARLPFLRNNQLRLKRFRQALLSLTNWRVLILAVGIATFAWLAEAIGLALIISNLAGFPLSWELVGKAIFIFCSGSILGFLSLLPGGLGVAEGGFIGLLIFLFGFSFSYATATTILLRLFTLWWGVGIGMVSFLWVLTHV